MHYPSVGDELGLVFDEDAHELDVVVDTVYGIGVVTKVNIKGSDRQGWVLFRNDGSYMWLCDIEEDESEAWKK